MHSMKKAIHKCCQINFAIYLLLSQVGCCSSREGELQVDGIFLANEKIRGGERWALDWVGYRQSAHKKYFISLAANWQ